MHTFFDRVIKPYIIENRYTDICEIGAQYGGHTDKLLSIDSIKLSIIDPCIDTDLAGKYSTDKKIIVHKGLSLDILPTLSSQFDCFLIDGDHNWYTVFNELKYIHRNNLLRKGGTIFFHDVCWPYGRRDLYYLPESIPDEFRHPYAKKGIERGRPELSETAVFNHDVNNAIREGGTRNGVLTAIEDFISEYGKGYIFFYFKKGYGLGFLIQNKNLKTRIMSLKWLISIKCYETIENIISFIHQRAPSLYAYGAKVAKKFGIKR